MTYQFYIATAASRPSNIRAPAEHFSADVPHGNISPPVFQDVRTLLPAVQRVTNMS